MAPRPNQRKLILVVVDSLRSDMLLRTVEAGDAPTFKKLLDRGELVPDCVSSFPSVTPVCTSEITTGVRPDQHQIPGMNWYHRAEERYVEYGSSFEATRLFGLFRSLYDTVYNLNMGHLNHETLTCFERLGDAGFRTACTPFLIYRGRTRHEVGLEGLLKAAASAAKFHHAVWGPDELFYGELYSSRKVDCKPTLARPATRDAYSACVGRELVKQDLYDFMLFSLPDNDYFSHRDGPRETQESIALADDALAELVDAHGGIEPFLEANGVIVVADHAQSHVTRPLPLAAGLGGHWDVLQPNAELDFVQHELAVGPSGRGAGIWVLGEPSRARDGLAAKVRSYVNRNLGEQIELIAWLSRDADGGVEAAVLRGEHELRFVPGGDLTDRRGETWSVEGDLATLTAEVRDGTFVSADYPDALARLWAALQNPNAADILLSLAPDWECEDWGGVTHTPGGSHGSLRAEDSLGTLLTVGLEGERPDRAGPESWAISDIAGLVDEHFGITAATADRAVASSAAG
ncbi:MAG: alkaline phosphatase family protein [Thermoleophilales bacterium]|nr:alkaline phosphatase family protein [Thermoleophilales bacterium]